MLFFFFFCHSGILYSIGWGIWRMTCFLTKQEEQEWAGWEIWLNRRRPQCRVVSPFFFGHLYTVYNLLVFRAKIPYSQACINHQTQLVSIESRSRTNAFGSWRVWCCNCLDGLIRNPGRPKSHSFGYFVHAPLLLILTDDWDPTPSTSSNQLYHDSGRLSTPFFVSSSWSETIVKHHCAWGSNFFLYEGWRFFKP